MKKIGKAVFLLLLALLLVLSISACGQTEDNKPDLGMNTVYQAAKELGFTGTLEELIEAFKGDSAYTIAVSKGYSGTETEWLLSLVGAKGEDGVSPHIGTNGNWFVGSTDTGVRAAGQDGLTPYIGTNGNWWIGTTDTGASASPEGLNAYEIYKKYYTDYQGTEEQWIEDMINGRLEGYIVAFNSLGGSAVSSLNVKKGNAVSAPANPTKNGYIFAGWYKESTLINKWNFDEPVNSNITLYAKWHSYDVFNFSFNTNTYTVSAKPDISGDIVIPSSYYGYPVTTIAENGFKDCTALTSITIPSSITAIYARAFEGCAGLTSITIPDNVSGIGSYAFANCTGLRSITIGKGVSAIGARAFLNCPYLTKINYNAVNNLTLLFTDNIFEGAGALGTGIKVIFGASVTAVPAYLFDAYDMYADYYGTPKITEVFFEAGSVCESIGLYALSCEYLTTIHVPASAVISWGAFYLSNKIQTVYYEGANTESLKKEQIYEQSLRSAAIYCYSATEPVTTGNYWRYVNGKPQAWGAPLNAVFFHIPVEGGVSMHEIKQQYAGIKITAPEIPQKEGHQFAGWFKELALVNEWNFENGLMPDENLNLYAKFTEANYNGTEGLEFNFIDGGRAYEVSKGSANTNGLVVIPSEYRGLKVAVIADSAFSECVGMSGIIIPASVKIIGDNAFYYCTALNNLALPDGLLVIGQNAFSNCRSLQTLLVPNSVTNIDFGAFVACYSLKNVTFADNGSLIELSEFLFYLCTSLETVELGSNNSLAKINNGAFSYCVELSEINLSNGILEIDAAFELCFMLTEIIIPASVKAINGAFSNCFGLESVIFEDGSRLQAIGDYTFMGCSNLSTITIPDGVESIGSLAFYNCSNLASVFIEGALTEGAAPIALWADAFDYCPGLTAIIVKDFATSDAYKAAERWSDYKDIIICLEAIFEGGDGSAETPFLISSYEQFEAIKLCPKANFKLISDIDFSGKNHVPLFDGKTAFGGVLDGGYFPINNMYVECGSPFSSLMGVIGETGAVKNLKIENFTIVLPAEFDTSEYALTAGAVAGLSFGQLTNISVRGKISGSINYDGIAIGGIAGEAANFAMENCHADIEIDISIAPVLNRLYVLSAGGLLGTAAVNISNSTARGSIMIMGEEGDQYTGRFLGGLAGMYYFEYNELPQISIADSEADVDIICNRNCITGGLIGHFDIKTIVVNISNCVAAGEIDVNGYYSGGFIGQFGGKEGTTITNCYATGNVTSSGSGSSNMAAGFIARLIGTGNSGSEMIKSVEILNCYALGDVASLSSAAGFIGLANYVSIENCYATGSVSALGTSYGNASGFAGEIRYGTVYRCYSTGDVTARRNAAGFIEFLLISEVRECFSAGDVTGNRWIGAFIYEMFSSSIYDCYASGDIYPINGTAQYIEVGFIAYMSTTSTVSTPIKNCYYSGKIYPVSNIDYSGVGGFAGCCDGAVENCHWLYYEGSPVVNSVGYIDSGSTVDITKHEGISTMLSLAGTLNGGRAEAVWVDVEGRAPQLAFMIQ